MPKVRLPSKSNSEIAYTLNTTHARTLSQCPRLIVFLNNLMMPAASWAPCTSILHDLGFRAPSPPLVETISILTYDRFGQGATTHRDPLDSFPGAEPGYGHDFLDVVHDLHKLINILFPRLYSTRHMPSPHLLLVGASIGAPLARLYAQTFPGTVSGIILLDSNICNHNYSDFWPDPKNPNFRPEAVIAPDCTLEQYIEATQKLAAIFDLHVKNPEHLDRRTSPALLPHADQPRLVGPGGGGVKLCVVGHDPEAFAQEGLIKMRTPKSFTARWVQTAWDAYNKELLEVGDTSDFPEVVMAKGCGHFVQRDDPNFVAEIVGKMLDGLQW